MLWRFHTAQWGPLKVSVMPLSTLNGVKDSNVGIVMSCEHGAKDEKKNENGVEVCQRCGAIRGAVVVRHGAKPLCDLRALANVIGFQAACKVLDAEEKVGTVHAN